jgi:hypothetical protein
MRLLRVMTASESRLPDAQSLNDATIFMTVAGYGISKALRNLVYISFLLIQPASAL